MNNQNLVKQFMEGLNQVNETPLDINNLSSKDIKNIKLRLTLTLEKTQELFEAFLDKEEYSYNIEPLFNIIKKNISYQDDNFDLNKTDIAHVIADLMYINYGTGVLFNLPLQKCFEEVHKSNMTKLINYTGNPIYRDDGKILYDNSYIPPNIKSIIDSHNSD